MSAFHPWRTCPGHVVVQDNSHGCPQGPRDNRGGGTARAAGGDGERAASAAPTEGAPPPPFGWAPSPRRLGEDLRSAHCHVAAGSVLENLVAFAAGVALAFGRDLVPAQTFEPRQPVGPPAPRVLLGAPDEV